MAQASQDHADKGTCPKAEDSSPYVTSPYVSSPYDTSPYVISRRFYAPYVSSLKSGGTVFMVRLGYMSTNPWVGGVLLVVTDHIQG
jgi:hypothetical protein